jgi:hypothetical protein
MNLELELLLRIFVKDILRAAILRAISTPTRFIMIIKEAFLKVETWFNEQFAWFFTNGMKAQQEAQERGL